MRKILKLVAATAIPLAALVTTESISAKVPERLQTQTTEAFKFAPKAKYEQGNRNASFKFTQGKADKVRSKVVTDSDISRTLPSAYSCGYVDGPDGTTWFYTGSMEYDEEELEGGYATKKVLKAYSFTIYDDNYKVVGTVKDDIVLADNETGVSSIQLCACVTKKFFNIDSNYEVMVMISANTAEYINHTYTKVYSIGGSSEAIATFEGYYVNAFNAGSEYSEKYYITFFDEKFVDSNGESCSSSADDAEYVLHYEIYAPASWSSATPTLIQTINTPYTNYEGSDGYPFFGVANNSKPYFAVIKFEQPFFASSTGVVYDPETGEMNRDMTPNLNNNLLIDLYTYSTYGGFSLVKETKIPMEVKDETGTQCCSFYELGVLNYNDDLSFDMWSDGELPAYVVTIEDYLTSSDESQYAFKVYDTDGNVIANIADEVDGLIDMSDLNGFEHQQGFYKVVDAEYVFQFVDLPSCNIVATIPVEVGENSLTSSADRYISGSSYQYAISLSYGLTDSDDNTSHIFNWYNADGTLDHTDSVPLGTSVAMALPYVKTKALNPYFFNSDDKREYMFLLKNYVSSTSSQTKESLVILNTDGDVLAKFEGNDELGSLASINPIYTSNPALWIIYYNDETDEYTSAFIDLPLSKFAGGDGSAENPYLISTIGDLQQIQSDLTANYKIINNIDASACMFTPISGEFTGTLDGNNMTISGLSINSDEYYVGIFQDVNSNAVIKDINFKNATIVINEGTSAAGLVAAYVAGNGSVAPTIENINVDNLDVSLDGSANASFGGIVGKMALSASVKGCNVGNSVIDLPYEGTYSTGQVGGIAGEIRTSSSVTSSAFSGYIAGAVGVGGIIGKVTTGDETVSNCHVNADVVGKNSVGGVIGSAARAKVQNCLVEGTVTATQNQNWGSGALVGGLIGELSEDWTGSSTVVVSNNVVAVSAINAPARPEDDKYESQSSTAHRIIGYSIYNAEPKISTVKNDAGEYEEVYGDLNSPDKGLENNYAVESLAVVDATIEATATSTEGASIAADALDKAFFESLGFAFGETVDAPWATSETLPVLYFESSQVNSVATITVASPVKFDGKNVIASGCTVAVYSISGLKVAERANSVSVANLAAGVYVAVATDAQGRRSAFKVTIK